MSAVRIDYLADHPEHLPPLAEWQFEEWDSILGQSLESRITKLKTHFNRDKLPIAWVAHADGQLLGSAALRLHDLDGREDLGPWLGGVIVGAQFRRQGIGAALCATVEEKARSIGIETLYLFTFDKQAWYSGMGWRLLERCVWRGFTVDVMFKRL
jgi:GNAT superfamily N-acetyltransferase